MTCLFRPAVQAGQVTLDNSLGQSGQTLTGPAYSLTPSYGRTIGNNLFFSFSQFNLASGDVATFSGPSTIQNILSRVTSGSPSSIDGTIQSTIPGANFFFINPNGIMFGPNAALNVSGSFAASTANYLKLSDGARFVAAVGADDSGLSSAPVSAFGFLGGNPGSISVQQTATSVPLAVPDGSTLSLVGGDISLNGSGLDASSAQLPTLMAAGGQINLVSVKSVGEVPLDATTLTLPQFDSAFPVQGQISLQNGALVDASGDGGGRIVIRGGSLMVDDSVIQANTTGSGSGQGIDIAVVNDVNLTSGGQINSISTAGLGAGGDITLNAASILVNGMGIIDSSFNPTTQISTGTGTQAQNPDGSTTYSGGAAAGGNISINTGSLEVENSAQISSASYGSGNAGQIKIQASSVLLDAMNFYIAQITANTYNASGGGNAGNITINANSLTLQNGAVIPAATFGDGNAGVIDIVANTVNCVNYGGVAVSTFGAGLGGSVQITADSIRLNEGSFINAITTSFGTPTASGGQISINTGSLAILNGSSIFATTEGDGNSGNIAITANSINIAGNNGAFGPFTGIQASDGNPFFGNFGIGNGGNININTGSLALTGGGQIFTSTLGTGSAGTINISANDVSLQGGSSIVSASTGSGLGGGLIGGLAGGVTLNLNGSLSLAGNSTLSVSSAENDAGSVTVNAGGNITLQDSGITAQAALNGGNISLASPSLIYLLRSPLTANAQTGNGGVITLDPAYAILNESPLTAKVSVVGNGGKVTVASDFFSARPVRST